MTHPLSDYCSFQLKSITLGTTLEMASNFNVCYKQTFYFEIIMTKIWPNSLEYLVFGKNNNQSPMCGNKALLCFSVWDLSSLFSEEAFNLLFSFPPCSCGCLDPQGVSTRVMIFSSFRESVQEIAAMLNRHSPLIRVMTFMGQASAGKGVKGFTQKEQLEVKVHFGKCDCKWRIEIL